LYLAVVALALAVRAPRLLDCSVRRLPIGMTETERAALSLAREGVLGNVFGDAGPSAHTAPLYPWLLAQLYRFADWRGVNARLVQGTFSILLTCFAICLAPVLARRMGCHPAAGWVAAILLCLLPGNRFPEISGACEQPLLAVGVPVLVLAFVSLQQCGWRSPCRVAATALLSGVLALLGPMFLSMTALMVLSQFITLRTRRVALFVGATGILIGMVLCLLPWAYRNHREMGGWVWTRSNFGLELWIGNNPHASGLTFCSHDARQHPFVNPEETKRLKQIGELNYMHLRGEQARAWIRSDPGRFAWLTVCRTRWFWFPSRHQLWGDGCNWVAPICCLLSLAMLGGLVRLFRTAHPHRWLLPAALIGFYLPYALTHVDVRYRYPLCGLINVLGCDLAIRGLLWSRRFIPAGKADRSPPAPLALPGRVRYALVSAPAARGR
jgi:hypothetical protein